MKMILALFLGLCIGLIGGGFLVAKCPGTLWYAVSAAAIGAVACVYANMKDLDEP